MDTPPADRQLAYNRWLPYWAVMQADINATLGSWIYRLWVLVSILAAVGYILYRYGLVQEAGLVQPASRLISDLLRWTVVGSVTLIVVLTAGCISSERGTMADSVLSRAISRHQYFLGKWHSRLFTVLATFLGMSTVVLLASTFLLHEDLSLHGCVAALLGITALLSVVVTCGVTVSSICNSTLLGVAVLWVFLYGGGFALSLLPASFPSPERMLVMLPHVLRGDYDPQALAQLAGVSVGLCVLVSLVGMGWFARRDI